MNKNNAIKLLFCILLCLLAGVIGSFFTASSIPQWYSYLKKPFLNPPNWVFGPVWTILFILMGISLYLVWQKNFIPKPIKNKKIKTWNSLSYEFLAGKWQKANIVLIFAAQLILNISWSIIFFGFKNPGGALSDILMLWFAIIFTIINFYRVSKPSAYLLIPYILWVSFAVYLNLSIWALNYLI